MSAFDEHVVHHHKHSVDSLELDKKRVAEDSLDDENPAKRRRKDDENNGSSIEDLDDKEDKKMLKEVSPIPLPARMNYTTQSFLVGPTTIGHPTQHSVMNQPLLHLPVSCVQVGPNALMGVGPTTMNPMVGIGSVPSHANNVAAAVAAAAAVNANNASGAAGAGAQTPNGGGANGGGGVVTGGSAPNTTGSSSAGSGVLTTTATATGMGTYVPLERNWAQASHHIFTILTAVMRQIEIERIAPDNVLLIDPKLYARHLRMKLDTDRISAKKKKRNKLAISITPFPFNVYEHFFPRGMGDFRTVSKKSSKKGIIRTTNTHSLFDTRSLDPILGLDWDRHTFYTNDREGGDIEGVMRVCVDNECQSAKRSVEIKYVVQDDKLSIKCFVQYVLADGTLVW